MKQTTTAILPERDVHAYLATLHRCRNASILAARVALLDRDFVQRTDAVLTAIDAVAERLTGDPHYFSIKAHTTALGHDGG